MINKIRNKIIYWQNILENQQKLYEFSKGHQVQLYNWSFPCIYDHWLIDFIEKRGLLKGKPKMKVGLYSIFAPFWLSRFDNCDIRIFVERENLHKPSMKKWLHRFIDDKRICLSLGFDDLDNPEYMRFPFWIMWSVFSPTATYKEIKQQIQRIDSPENHNYTNREFCTFICGHDDIGRKQIFDKLCNIDNIHCPGRLFHNNDDLKNKYNDNKLEYLKHYRFNLTPENSNYKGYVTEKLFEAIYAGCIPIYHESDNYPEPNVLNQDAIIFIVMGKDNSNAIKLISELNSDKKKYMDFACQKRFIVGAEDVIWEYYERLEKKLKEIIANS